MVAAINEQIYRDLETGAIAQTRQELSDGSVVWERPDGSVWDGPIHQGPACLVSNTTRRRFQKVRTILATHSIEIRLLESGRVSLWHTGPFGNPEPREYQDLMSVVDEQLPLTKDDRLLSYV